MSDHYESYRKDRNSSISSTSKRKRSDSGYDNHERKKEHREEGTYKGAKPVEEDEEEEASFAREMQSYRERLREQWGDRIRHNREREKEGEKEGEKGRDKERNKERHKEREKERDKERNKERDRQGEKSSQRGYERERERDRRRDRSPEERPKKTKKKEHISHSSDEEDKHYDRRNGKSRHRVSSGRHPEDAAAKRAQRERDKYEAKESRGDKRRRRKRNTSDDRSDEGRKQLLGEGLKGEKEEEKKKKKVDSSSDEGTSTGREVHRRKERGSSPKEVQKRRENDKKERGSNEGDDRERPKGGEKNGAAVITAATAVEAGAKLDREDEKKLSRLERLKQFAEKIKKKGSDEANPKAGARATKFTLNTGVNSASRKIDLDVFGGGGPDEDEEDVEEGEENKKQVNKQWNLKEGDKKQEEKMKKDSATRRDLISNSPSRRDGAKDPAEESPATESPAAEDNEEDPLEVFMRNLERNCAGEEGEAMGPNQAITLEEIYSYEANRHRFERAKHLGGAKHLEEQPPGVADDSGEVDKEVQQTDTQPPESGDLEDDQNGEEYHRLFIEALRRKAEEEGEGRGASAPRRGGSNAGSGQGNGEGKDEEINALNSEGSSEPIENLSEDSEYNIETNALKKTNKKLLQVNRDQVEYLPIKKNIYVQVSEITNMKESDVDLFRKNNGNIIVRGKNCPRPVQYFYQCGLPSRILPILEKKNFKKMFGIQMQTIPALMCGRDVIAIAETGSGKTLSYLFPLIRHVLHQPPLRNNDGPIAIILTPTRELSKQVKSEARPYCQAVNLRILAVYGGSNIGTQLNTLKRGVEILVGTPGRIIDILTISNCKVTNLNRVSFVVLDEADRLLDLGFESQIHNILNNCRKDKQTAMISATFPTYIQSLAKKLLYKPIEIIVGEKGKTNNNIYQFVEVLQVTQKIFRLLKLLGDWATYGLILIFVNKQLEADLLYLELFKYDYKTLVLHGGQDQADREFTLQTFKEGKNKILISTSVMARGIDIKDIIVVINYECPDHIEDYIHRVGRTGRSNKIGYAYTFVTPEEQGKAYDIYSLIKNNIYYMNKTIDIPRELEELVREYTQSSNFAEVRKKGYKGKGFKFTPNEKSRLQMDKANAKRELGLVRDKEGGVDNPPGGDASDGEVDRTAGSAGTAGTAAAGEASMPGGIAPPHGTPHTGAPLKQTGPQQRQPQPPPPPGEPSPQSEIKRIELEIQRIKMNDTMDLSLKAKQINELMKTYNFMAQQQSTLKKNADATKEADIEKMAEQEAAKATEHIKDETERQRLFNKVKQDVKKRLTDAKLQSNSKTENIHRNMLLNSMRTRNMKKYSPFIPHTYVMEDNSIMQEFYINDYPQHVRLKVCNREVLSRISDMSGSRCQIKGQYFNPTQPNKTTFLLDAKPLHIEITASNYNQVQIAHNELTSLINQLLQNSNMKGHRKG
ncbi:adenosinetriphosphatase [Plasmodium inui San Antonio 1]|uniref:RNA helicase n=1 Tax=Plasmodium inui San Antonio 1 TaxID=1237626 RepID=W7ARV3_9APIC|nr:adenosinetriphosphatase [Plasmodium inui San Antonio 1]EUD68211.1 adenosinetriphosphatase [Plasmodium inui San Antonio 1]